MDNAIASVCAQFKAKEIVLPPTNEWLIACVECFFEMKPNHTPSELFEFAYEQWTLADLSDVNAPSLPPACKSCNKIVLPNKYAVQVNFVINVAIPFHKQLQEIRRPEGQKNLEVDNERQERERAPKTENNRLLKLEITDGVTTVTGFEYTPIPAIIRCVPGEKMLLIGPIEARKGALFLKPENVMMLGGEVDTLLISNAMENVLARSLKEPENPDPYRTAANNGQPSGLQAAASQTLMPPPPALAPGNPTVPNSHSQRTSATLVSQHPRLLEPTLRPPTASHFPSPASRPTQLDMSGMLDDGEDDIFASLTEALDNNSFGSEESTPSNSSQYLTSQQRKISSSPKTNHTAVTQNLLTKNKNNQSSKLTQPTLTGFLSQKKAHETSIGLTSGSFPSPHPRIRLQESTANREGKLEPYVMSRLNGSSSSVPSVQQNKRKEHDADMETFGSTTIPSKDNRPATSRPEPSNRLRGDSTVTSSVVGGSKLTSPNDDLQFDWIPPPKKANLEQLRPSHEKGKILIDYTNSASLDLNLLSSQSEKIAQEPKVAPIAVKTAIDIEPFPPKEYPSRRTARAKVVQMNKLKISNGKWQLTATIAVKGVQIQVDFSPESVDKLLTVSCEEIERHKPDFAKDPELKQKYNDLIKMGQERVRNLDCEVEIYFKNFISKPILTNVFL